MGNYLDCWGDDTNTVLPTNLSAINASCFPNHLDDGSNGYACRNPYTYIIEHYTPPYKSRTGPSIASAPEVTTYNSTIVVYLNATTGIVPSKLVLIRYSTTTHSTNTDQRYLEPTLLFINASLAVIRAPPSGGIAPPGNYHLFAVAADGTPSTAAMVRIAHGDAVTALPSGVTTTAATAKSTSTSAARPGPAARTGAPASLPLAFAAAATWALGAIGVLLLLAL
ncbi:hypothetical protein HK405_001749 [Cladochytrium tenue]|nr:hypothetical protein HK405_001749 [Cladochytrium tenue]